MRSIAIAALLLACATLPAAAEEYNAIGCKDYHVLTRLAEQAKGTYRDAFTFFAFLKTTGQDCDPMWFDQRPPGKPIASYKSLAIEKGRRYPVDILAMQTDQGLIYVAVEGKR